VFRIFVKFIEMVSLKDNHSLVLLMVTQCAFCEVGTFFILLCKGALVFKFRAVKWRDDHYSPQLKKPWLVSDDSYRVPQFKYRSSISPVFHFAIQGRL